ncbi:SGNH/GDSL hydrolase family protein [Kiritimatiellota bacterium B12222]|nr:SGNH/GDSL hydrolase family protein [Kiritimatiellota bacterium B12222]
MEIKLDQSYFQGAVSLEMKEDGIHPWRLPLQDLALYKSHDGLSHKLKEAAGVRIRFHTDSPFVELDVGWVEGEHLDALFDLVVDGDLTSSVCRGEERAPIRFENLSGALDQIQEIWLPVGGAIVLRSLKIEEGRSLTPVDDQRLRWVTYGSSISHCNGCASPSRTWPAVCARTHNLDLTCLGVAGQCHIDSMIAMMIRDLPADVITLKLGINVYGRGSLNARSFVPAVVGFVRIVREKHPNTPIGLITPIYSDNRETEANHVAWTLENYREALRSAYEVLRAHGDEHIFMFEGPELLSEREASLLPDNLHPNGEGYELMGTRAAQNVLPLLLNDRI